MKRTDTPRRQRARLKAWAYLALFGPGEDSDEEDEDCTPDTESADDRDRNTPGE